MTYSLKLSSLDGTNGFRINGGSAGDYTGISVSGAGDVDGDGIDDLLIGAHLADPNGANSGRAYVVYGRNGDFFAAVDLSGMPASQGFVLNGATTNDLAGFSVSEVGDFNNDGRDDFVVSAFGSDTSGTDAGSSWVVFGRAGDFASTVDLSAIGGGNGVRIDGGIAGELTGISVSSAGDVNGDGFVDIIIGANGIKSSPTTTVGGAYIVFGKASGFTTPINLNGPGNGVVKITGAVGSGHTGERVSGGGDFNGDGFADVLISAYGINSYAGGAYVVFGGSSLTRNIGLGGLNGSTGFTILGSPGQFAGMSVGNAGDVNGDGIDDIMVGAPFTNANAASGAEGAAYVIFGSRGGFDPTLNLADVDGTNGFRMFGENSFAGFTGWAVASAGDINGDGLGDMLVSAKKAGSVYAGSVYVVFGQSGGFSPDLDLGHMIGSEGFRIDGSANGDNFGFSVSGAGDVNGDGFDDIIVGAYKADPTGLGNEGAGYVIFGRGDLQLSPELKLADLRDSQGFRLKGGDNNLAGYAVSSAGDVNGDGIDDMLVSAPGITSLDAGRVYLVYGTTGARPLEVNLATMPAQVGTEILGALADDQTATSVSFGDINGDGIDDVILGSTQAAGTGTDRGASYVVFGKVGGLGETLNLAGLNGTNGFRIDGQSNGDLSGVSVAADDVNDDGVDDLIIGASGRNDAGAAYVVFGGQSFGSAFGLGSVNGTNGFRLDGLPRSFSGIDVAAAGDVDGDGINDLLVGAVSTSTAPGRKQGAAYLVFGDSTPSASTNLNALGDGGYVLLGVRNRDYAGLSVSGAGDVNGDGFDDLIIGAHGSDIAGDSAGSAYVVFGGTANLAALDGADGTADGRVQLSKLNGKLGFRLDGTTAGDYAGYSVAGAGDVNGDGFDDLLIGAYRASPDLHTYAGSSFIVYGKAGGFSRAVNLADLDGADGFRIDGVAAGDQTGFAVSGAGDVNNDGFADIIIGADRSDVFDGVAYVLYGMKPTFAVHRIGSAADQRILGGLKDDVLEGKGGRDELNGNEGSDTLVGGTGRDVLIGGLGRDVFDFNSLGEAGNGASGRDVVKGFNAGSASSFVDRIDLRGIDAVAGVAGNQAFDFIGTDTFRAAGDLRAVLVGGNTIVSGDVDGDGNADFQIQINGSVKLFDNDFFL